MKTIRILIVYLIYVTLITSGFAQDDAKVELPEGAITRLGKGGINVIQFSPDGTRLAVGTSIGVWLYSVKDEIEIALPTENIRYFTTLAFSNDGKLLAAGGIINSGIQTWDINTGNIVSSIKLPDRFHRVSELTFSKENKSIVGLGANRYITEWDINSGKEISQKEVYFSRQVHAFSHDGRSFVSGHQENGEIRIWNTESGIYGDKFQEKTDMSTVAPLPSFAVENPEKRKFIGGIQAIAYSPDRKTIVSAHNNHCIRIWNIKNKIERYTLKGHTEKINTVAYSTDSKTVASGSYDNTIHLWDVERGKQKGVLTEHRNGVKALAFSPSKNELLASGSEDGTVRFWDVNTGQQLSIFATGFTHSVKALAFTEDNTMLVSAAENGSVQMWDVKNGIELPFRTEKTYDSTEVALFSKDATLYAVRGAETLIESDGSGRSTTIVPQKETLLLKLSVGTELFSIPHKTSALGISPDNKMIAIGNENETVLYNIDTKEELHRFDASHSFDRNAVSFSPNNTILVTGGGPGEIYLWHVHTGEKLITLTDPFIGTVESILFSREGSILATRTYSRVRFWDLNTQKQLYSNLGNKIVQLGSFAFSPDEKILLTSKWHHELGSQIQLWDVKAESKLINLEGHFEHIESMIFSHDGKVLATGSKDGTVLLWNWEQILDKIGRENIGIIPNKESKSDSAKQIFNSKAEEAQAIMKWLEDKEYKLQKIGDKCKIAQGKSRVMMMDTRGGAMIMQDIKFEFTRDGILRITIKDIGSADFTFDDKDELELMQTQKDADKPE